MCFDRSYPADAMADYARSVESAGIEQLWVIEDCFFTAGISLAATALAVTDSLTVGLGVLPAVARNPAITAMEVATLATMAPGRLVAGIGHGVQEWMAQIGALTPSPLTTLDETITVVKRLLRGDEVTFSGRQVVLDRVRLDQPPSVVPPVVAGVQQQRSMALAGRVADGVILVEGAGPVYVRWALDHAAPVAAEPFRVTTFTLLAVEADRRAAYRTVAPFVAGLVAQRRPALTVLPFFDEMAARVAERGAAALVDMPGDFWAEIGAVGTLDDALDHVAALEAAGVHSVNIFPGPQLADARALLPVVAELAAR